MTTHTPGPWKIHAGRGIETPSGCFYVTYGKDKHENPLWKGSFSELDSNARLIAQAPTMLAALEQAEQVFNDTSPDPLQAMVMIERIRHVIKQAKRE